jgi:hypothetical protein
VTEAKGAKGWDMTIPGSDEERRARLAGALRMTGIRGPEVQGQAVLPDSLIVATYGPDGERTYSVAYVEDAAVGGFAFSPPVEVDIRPAVFEKADNIAGLQSIVDMAATQMKAGAVLSAAKLTLVEAAIEALTALRAAARKESAGDTGAKGDEPDAPAAPAAPDAAMPRTDWGFRLRLAEAVAAHASQRTALLPRAI